jgi:MFS family permease
MSHLVATMPSRRGAYLGLAVLTLINMVNYLDRYLVPSLVESIKHSDFQLTDFQLGALNFGFLIVYTLVAPIFGVLGDRGSRPRWIAFGIFLWSGATALSGLARSYSALLISRTLVGVGEASYVAIAPSLLSDYFPRRLRGRVFAVFFCAIPVGSALGYVFGGLIDKHYGWRAAFLIGGIPGLVLAALTLLLRDPVRGSGDAHEDQSKPVPSLPRNSQTPSALATYRSFLANRPYVLTVLGYAAYTFAVGGLAFWMPAFLERIRGVPRASATIGFGGIVVVTGFVGTFAGGWLGDHWAKTSRQGYLWLSSWTTFLAVPCACVALIATTPAIYYSGIVVAELLLFMSTGPINSAIVNYVAPDQRASAMALSVFAIHALGDVVSPPLIGMLSDQSSLASAVLLVPVAIACGGAIWYLAGRAGRQRDALSESSASASI